MIFFTPLFNNIDDALQTFVDTAATHIATYINLTTTIAATLTLIFLGLQLSHAVTEIPLKKLLITFATIALVSSIAGVPANYHDYVSQYLMSLPADFAAGIAGNNDLANQNIGSYLDQTIGDIMQGIALIFKHAGLTNIGDAFLGVLLFVMCSLLAAAATISICIGKVGLALVVALGPFFIMCLLTPWTKDLFTRWLSYALHFTVLQGLIAGTLLVAKILIERYVIVLSNPIWDFNDMIPILAPSIVMLVLTFLFSQLPSIASSMTGGIGLSMGNTAWSGMTMAAGAAGYAFGKAGRGIAAAGAAGAGWGWSRMTGSGGNSVTEGAGSSQAQNEIIRSQRTQEPAAPPQMDAQRAPAQRSSGSAAAFARMQAEMRREEMRRQNNDPRNGGDTK